QQLVEENHLRWDSLGEFLALGASLDDLGRKHDNPKATVLARTLDTATGLLLENRKSPSRATGELDNRGSQFWLALYWAQDLAAHFGPLAEKLTADRDTILEEMSVVQGKQVDLDGYFQPSVEKLKDAMRPSETFNTALADTRS